MADERFTLDSIEESKPEPRAICLAGEAGIGKTTVASMVPNAIVMPTERGTSGLKGVKKFPIVQKYSQILDIIESLMEEEHDYKVLVPDTVTSMERLIHEELCRVENVPSIEKVGGGWFKWRNEALIYWQEILDGFDALRDYRGMDIMLLAHIDQYKEEPPDTEPYKKYGLRLKNPEAKYLIEDWCDIVGFYKFDVSTKIVDEKKVKGGRTKTTSRSTASKRKMYFDPKPAFFAKNRFGLPSEITVSKNSHEILETLGYKKPAKPTPKKKGK